MTDFSSLAPVIRAPMTMPELNVETARLPLCTLNLLAGGSGPPLIMVPATLSELDNWRDLVGFMAQWFRAYFFELPGHGGSSALPLPYSSDLVAETIHQFVDHQGIERFSLMGFSFGGILAMKTYARLHERVDRVILLAPCVAAKALRLSPIKRIAADALNAMMRDAAARRSIHAVIRSRAGSNLLARVVHTIGRVENLAQLATKLQRLTPAVMEILSRQLDEILGIEFDPPSQKWPTPCYFAMSIRDPLLSYKLTLEVVRAQFGDVRVTTLGYPFHQPPRPFTFDELNRTYADSVEAFMVGQGAQMPQQAHSDLRRPVAAT